MQQILPQSNEVLGPNWGEFNWIVCLSATAPRLSWVGNPLLTGIMTDMVVARL